MPPTTLAFTRHDHARCRTTVLDTIDGICEERNVRLTPARRRTLEILLQSHQALGAYEVLEQLAQSGFGEKPPQVYRALTFLMEQGFAHKLERKNAYVACVNPGECDNPCLMVCKSCGRVAEQIVPKANRQLEQAADQVGFSTLSSVIELSGVCGLCPQPA